MTRSLISDGPVLLDLESNGIARIRLNRPDASNGMDVALLKALHEAILRVHGERSARVVILSGEGRHFCAGGDVKTFASKGDGLPDYLREATAWLQIATSALIQLRVPVVASVHGFAAGGGGLGLVCASDFVIAADDAKFMSGAVRVGMAPDGGASVTLTQLVGLRKTAEILLTNPVLDAKEALAIGLLTKVVPTQELATATEDYALQFTRSAPLAVEATKRLLWGGVGSSVADRLDEEARTVSELSGTADSLEGLAAVIEKRAPRFEGR